MEKRITTPITKDKIKDLHAGDSVLITGVIYTARDAAHERMVKNFNNGEPFPIDLKDNTIYYAGLGPEKPGEVIGVGAGRRIVRAE
ncbi:MAG: fumarate hydratase C-terminal domain-containing protein, partial [Clostridia bacterium]|nr:fumarate hydratase C-terminal domain-containing protein [Clostridia bacterium]